MKGENIAIALLFSLGAGPKRLVDSVKYGCVKSTTFSLESKNHKNL